MNIIEQMLRNIGPVRMAAVFIVMLSIAAFFFYLITRSSSPDMIVLFSQLENDDAARIVSRLDGMGVPVEIKAGGTQVWVPSDQVSRLRMDMAQSGLPSGGIVGYEIFDRTDTLGTSSSMMSINYLRALEGELSKSVRSINSIRSARVHLVLPKRELFSREHAEPSASVIIKMSGPGRLSRNQVAAIQHLISSAVPKLAINKIAIIDDKGTLLAKSRDSDDALASMDTHQDARIAYENRLARVIESLLVSSLGPGKVRAEVNVAMDFDTLTIQSEEFDPEGQVVRSTTTTSENSDSKESADGQGVTVQNALPSQGEEGGGSGQNSATNKRTEETINYEISRTTKQQTKRTGVVKKLSVAVIVDGVYTTDDKGEEQYQTRSKEELEQIKSLIRTAVGFDKDRGDILEVVNMQFTALTAQGMAEDPSAAASLLDNINIANILEIAVLAIVGLLVLLMVVRPLLIKMIEKAQPIGADQGDFTSDYNIAGAPALAGPGGGALNISSGESADGGAPPKDDRRANAMKKMEEIVDQRPEEAVSIIRSWMSEDA